MRRYVRLSILMLLISVAAFSSCEAQGQMNVDITDFSFQPATISVPVGTTVTWTNQDSVDHTVTSQDGLFDSGIVGEGESFSYTFMEPGNYAYFCSIHPSMRGMVTVTSEAMVPPEAIVSPEAMMMPRLVMPPEAVRHTVDIKDFTFQPDVLRVPAGTTVMWINRDNDPHTVTSQDGKFDSGIMRKDSVYKYTFNCPATYQYHCSIHPFMHGKVIVLPRRY